MCFCKKFWDDRVSLYSALSAISECDCHQSQTALLMLENRKSGHCKSKLHFSIILISETCSADTELNFLEAQDSSISRSTFCSSVLIVGSKRTEALPFQNASKKCRSRPLDWTRYCFPWSVFAVRPFPVPLYFVTIRIAASVQPYSSSVTDSLI
jgi:hypothetical protein